jgi:hypothetical protein
VGLSGELDCALERVGIMNAKCLAASFVASSEPVGLPQAVNCLVAGKKANGESSL